MAEDQSRRHLHALPDVEGFDPQQSPNGVCRSAYRSSPFQVLRAPEWWVLAIVDTNGTATSSRTFVVTAKVPAVPLHLG